ncbi:uncharacterized protein LOC144330927 [Macaca mulatta]
MDPGAGPFAPRRVTDPRRAEAAVPAAGPLPLELRAPTPGAAASTGSGLQERAPPSPRPAAGADSPWAAGTARGGAQGAGRSGSGSCPAPGSGRCAALGGLEDRAPRWRSPGLQRGARLGGSGRDRVSVPGPRGAEERRRSRRSVSPRIGGGERSSLAPTPCLRVAYGGWGARRGIDSWTRRNGGAGTSGWACDPAHPRSFFLAPGPSSLALPTSWAGRPSPSARIPGLLSSTPDLSKGLQWTRSPRPAAPVHQGDGHLPPANHDVPRGGTSVSPAHLLLCISENPSAYTEAPHQAKPGAPDPVARSGSICDALHSSLNHSAPPRPLREHLPSRRPR